VEQTEKMFLKRHQFLLSVLKRLGLEKVEGLLSVPRIEGSKVTLLAILIQNLQHPKNQHRREAIKNQSYIELKTEGMALMYLEKLVYKNLEIEFKNQEGLVNQGQNKQFSQECARDFVQANNQFVAAAVLHSAEPKHGNGDVTVFIKQLMAGNVEDAKNKLRLLTQGQIADYRLFFDKFKSEVPVEFRIAKKMINKLWFHFVRKEKTLTTADFIELFPYREAELKIWE